MLRPSWSTAVCPCVSSPTGQPHSTRQQVDASTLVLFLSPTLPPIQQRLEPSLLVCRAMHGCCGLCTRCIVSTCEWILPRLFCRSLQQSSSHCAITWVPAREGCCSVRTSSLQSPKDCTSPYCVTDALSFSPPLPPDAAAVRRGLALLARARLAERVGPLEPTVHSREGTATGRAVRARQVGRGFKRRAITLCNARMCCLANAMLCAAPRLTASKAVSGIPTVGTHY